MQRFLEKRKKRIWHKKVKYTCRKKLADNRPRVKGRFVKRLPGEVDINMAAKKRIAIQST